MLVSFSYYFFNLYVHLPFSSLGGRQTYNKSCSFTFFALKGTVPPKVSVIRLTTGKPKLRFKNEQPNKSTQNDQKQKVSI
jgi:hypothetical protein